RGYAHYAPSASFLHARQNGASCKEKAFNINFERPSPGLQVAVKGSALVYVADAMYQRVETRRILNQRPNRLIIRAI
ncbi:MAG TPA: hypothetical protein VI386_24020, partial [Candidatus Sulfotelmatobacter sp.]